MRVLIRFVRLSSVLATLAVLWIPVGPILGAAPALAQTSAVSAEFRTALEPYGSFRHVGRWGEVWVPSHISRDWRPYTVGHWVYSDDYGWYWVSDQQEAPWGWVAFHYGRWVRDEGVGWVWVPGSEWAPAWVEWRRGRSHIGWAPLPPDEVIVTVREDPQYWVFVRPHDFLAERIATVIVQPEPAFLRDTVVVNETVTVHDRRFGVNPGIEPAFIAADIGRPVPAFNVQPRVLAGTANIQGAIQVRAQDLRNEQFRQSIARESNVRQTSNTIRPAANVPQPTPLAATERGRLGQNPPRAAAGVAQQPPQQQGTQQQSTTGAAPSQQQPQRGERERQQQGTSGAPPSQQQPQRGERARPQQGTTGAAPSQQPPQRGERGRPQQGTTGAASSEQRPQRSERGREQPGTTGAAPSRQQPQSGERGHPQQGTTGAAPSQQQPQRGERARPQQGTTGAAPSQQQPQRGERGRPQQGTTGTAPSEQRPQRSERGREQPGTTGAAPSRQQSQSGERGRQQPGTTGAGHSEQRPER